MTLPEDDPYYPQTTTYWDRSTEVDQIHEFGRHACGHVARVQSGWAPDTGRHWFRCTGCGAEWNGNDQEGSQLRRKK